MVVKILCFTCDPKNDPMKGRRKLKVQIGLFP